MNKATTLGELKTSGYISLTVKQELRKNLLLAITSGKDPFEGTIIGYEDTVIPDVKRAILSGHNINFLGLRGQAKTRMARLMVNLLDEYVPVIKDSALNEDPLNPISAWGKKQVGEKGDELPIGWMHRSERFSEKLATPDVSVADLIGDIDPIKAASLKLSFSDEQVIHYGLIPRSNRGIFVINELPDLQARIQVALFNILQEGDIQIRGFKVRLPLDIQFVFTANPEDYTNRGAIVTPLKDRIESQILTHYPKTVEDSLKITHQEADIKPEQKETIFVPELVKLLLEQVGFEARKSDLIDAKSGVSARLTIASFEALLSTAELRMLENHEKFTFVRIVDVLGIVPAINGKVELVYEGEQEGREGVAHHLIGKAVRTLFPLYFPDPERIKRKKEDNPYRSIIQWFEKGNEIDLQTGMSLPAYKELLDTVPGLNQLVRTYHPQATEDDNFVLRELVLFGLAEYSLLSRHILNSQAVFKDILNSVFSSDEDDFNEEDYR